MYFADAHKYIKYLWIENLSTEPTITHASGLELESWQINDLKFESTCYSPFFSSSDVVIPSNLLLFHSVSFLPIKLIAWGLKEPEAAC
jgi:hypothetical protein